MAQHFSELQNIASFLGSKNHHEIFGVNDCNVTWTTSWTNAFWRYLRHFQTFNFLLETDHISRLCVEDHEIAHRYPDMTKSSRTWWPCSKPAFHSCHGNFRSSKMVSSLAYLIIKHFIIFSTIISHGIQKTSCFLVSHRFQWCRGFAPKSPPSVISISAAIPRYASKAPRARTRHPNPMPQMFMTCATLQYWGVGIGKRTTWVDQVGSSSRFLEGIMWS